MMRIAEYAQVRGLYPDVRPAAILHLLWALDQTAGGEVTDAGTVERRLRSALAGYRGPWADFERLRVREIFAALQTHRPAAVVDTLGILGLLDTTRRLQVVIVADPLAGRIWARERGYTIGEYLVLRSSADVAELRVLRGLDDPRDLDVVRLGPCTPHLDHVLRVLIAAGARERPGTWRPEPAGVHAGR